MLIGVIIILMAAVNDTLSIERITNNYRLSHTYAVAFSLFLLCQIYIIFLNISEKYKQAQQAAETQLTSLQSQIKPHFLYNILNTIQYLVDQNPNNPKNSWNNYPNTLEANFMPV